MGEPLDVMVADLEARRFVGRGAVLALASRARSGAGTIRIIHLHGSAGVGKSATLRAIARDSVADGWSVVHLDGRLLGATPDQISSSIDLARGDDAVLLIDEADALGPLANELRRVIRTQVAASTVVVFAGRLPPDHSWFEDGLESVSTAVALRPLSNDESRDLLARYGLTEGGDDLDRIVAWSAGYPLALTLAAALDRSDPEEHSQRLAAGPSGQRLDQVLVERLGGSELAGVNADVLDVACVASSVDGRLLAAALPGRPTRLGLTQLRACSLSEPLGSGVTLHRLVRSALRTRLRSTDPDRYRDIVLRVARHLRGRAVAGDHRVVLELADLIEDADLRLGFDPSPTHYPDQLRVDDLPQIAEFTGAQGTAWFGRIERWCTDAPRHAVAVRRADGSLVGMSIIHMADETPAWARDEIETGPVLAWAGTAGHADNAALMHDMHVMEDPADPAACAEVIRVGNIGAIAGGVVRNARYVYVTASSWRTDDGTEALGYQDVAELRRHDGERQLSTIMTDFGPDGVVGQLYSLILAEQGAGPAPATGVAEQAFDTALRSFLDDAALAGTALAPDSGSAAERAEHVRAHVRGVIGSCFGESADDRILRQAIERTYLDPEGGHAIAQRELHMSRSSFYRLLRRARERLNEAAASQQP